MYINDNELMTQGRSQRGARGAGPPMLNFYFNLLMFVIN